MIVGINALREAQIHLEVLIAGGRWHFRDIGLALVGAFTEPF
jgi:hypothetical protein